MVRVLVVDDSPTYRYLIRSVLESDPEIQVVGEAANGEEALQQVERLDPDLVTMDIRMPKMDGYQAIRHIMAEFPRPVIVLTTTASDIELGTSYRAIESGALMVLRKPHNLPDTDPEARRLIDTVKALAEVKVVRRRWHMHERAGRAPTPRPRFPAAAKDVRLVAMGASTGGPPALQVVLQALPADLPVPVTVVQHISQGFVHGLARWLDSTTPLTVQVATQGELLQPGVVYLAPDNYHLLVPQNNVAFLSTSPPVDGHRPSVTALFESIAESYGPHAVGVLLTGMGQDGARGLQRMHDAGAHTIAQDEATSVVFGMPKEAIALGAADEVLPLEHIGPRLAQLVGIAENQNAHYTMSL